MKRDGARMGCADACVDRPRPHINLDEIQPILDEELERLPESLAAPLVLCYLEAKTRDEAAHQLGWSLRTVMRRLEKGRQLLRGRLTRRGVTMGAALITTGLSASAARALVPTAIVEMTVKAATSIAQGGTAVLIVSTRVAALTQGVLNAMFMSKLKVATGIMIAALASTGVGFHSLSVKATDPTLLANSSVPAPGKVAAKEGVSDAKESDSQKADEPGSLKQFESAPGFSWFLHPFKWHAASDPGAIQASQFKGGSLTVTPAHNGSLVIVLSGAEPTMKSGTIYRPVVFDDHGTRYLPEVRRRRLQPQRRA